MVDVYYYSKVYAAYYRHNTSQMAQPHFGCEMSNHPEVLGIFSPACSAVDDGGESIVVAKATVFPHEVHVKYTLLIVRVFPEVCECEMR
jgi:hypothetical protein